jgi:hypothetical protein
VTSIRYAARYRCDFCGKIADLTPRGDDEVYPAPVPEGWLVAYGPPTHPGLRVFVEAQDGQRYTDICDDCAQIPLFGLLDMLERKLTGEPAR